jgi:Pentapeptide repeats (8 copies)
VTLVDLSCANLARVALAAAHLTLVNLILADLTGADLTTRGIRPGPRFAAMITNVTAHIKMVKRQNFGRAGLPLLRKRVLLTAKN